MADYTQPLQDLLPCTRGKCLKTLTGNGIDWIAKALTYEMVVPTRVRLLMMMGDCLKNTGETAKAKQSYNQAFIASAGIENKAEMKQLQQMIQQSLQGL